MSEEERKFIDEINGVGAYKPKPKFLGTGRVGKQSFEAIWTSNKDAIKPGEFGTQLAKWAKQENERDFNKTKEQILEDIRKEQYNG